MTTPAPRKFRIAFLSELFHVHIISQFSAGIMQQMPRDRFEVIAIHVMRTADGTTAVADYVDRVVEIHHQSLEETRQVIAELELDILFYTDIGMMPTSYFLAFSRLAHVQCVYLGHPVTTGIPNMDYFISADGSEPENAEQQYSEKLVRLEGLAVYFAKFPAHTAVFPNIRQHLGLPPGARLYTCPVTLFKFHPDYDAAIDRIMTADPEGHFIIIEGTEPHLAPALCHRLLKKFPYLKERLHVSPSLSLPAFIGFIQEVDCVLDSFYFGAGTTAYFACAVGVPIISLPSPFVRGRAGISVYQEMDILDPLAADFDDYVAKAVRLANDKEWYATLQKLILERCDILFERWGFIGELAKFLEAAIQAKLAGAPLVDWRPKVSEDLPT